MFAPWLKRRRGRARVFAGYCGLSVQPRGHGGHRDRHQRVSASVFSVALVLILGW